MPIPTDDIVAAAEISHESDTDPIYATNIFQSERTNSDTDDEVPDPIQLQLMLQQQQKVRQKLQQLQPKIRQKLRMQQQQGQKLLMLQRQLQLQEELEQQQGQVYRLENFQSSNIQSLEQSTDDASSSFQSNNNFRDSIVKDPFGNFNDKPEGTQSVLNSLGNTQTNFLPGDFKQEDRYSHAEMIQIQPQHTNEESISGTTQQRGQTQQSGNNYYDFQSTIGIGDQGLVVLANESARYDSELKQQDKQQIQQNNEQEQQPHLTPHSMLDYIGGQQQPTTTKMATTDDANNYLGDPDSVDDPIIKDIAPTSVGVPNNISSKKKKRPANPYTIFLELERERILNELENGGRPNDIRKPFTMEDIKNKKSQPPTKRRHRKSHGLIGFKELSQRVAAQWRACSDDERQVFYDYYSSVELPNHLQSKIDSKDHVGDTNSSTKEKRQQQMEKNFKNDDGNLNKRKRKQNEYKQPDSSFTKEQDSVEELRHVITNRLQHYSDKERNELIDYIQKLPKETPNIQNDIISKQNGRIDDEVSASIQEYSKYDNLDNVTNNDFEKQHYMQKDPPISNQSKLYQSFTNGKDMMETEPVPFSPDTLPKDYQNSQSIIPTQNNRIDDRGPWGTQGYSKSTYLDDVNAHDFEKQQHMQSNKSKLYRSVTHENDIIGIEAGEFLDYYHIKPSEQYLHNQSTVTTPIPPLLQFLSENQDCFKNCTAYEYHEWLRSEDVESLQDFAEAVQDDDFALKMKQRGIKGFKMPFIQKSCIKKLENKV